MKRLNEIIQIFKIHNKLNNKGGQIKIARIKIGANVFRPASR